MPDDINAMTLKRAGMLAGAVALAVAAVGVGARLWNHHTLAEEGAGNAVPAVEVVRPTRSSGAADLTLPGTIQAYNSAPIYARTNGYVSRWIVDIGDDVREGQTLAILDAPEVDQQLAQAQADYQTAVANQQLARTTSVRWAALRAKDAVSQQEADEKAGDLAAKSALANAARANVNRLRALQGFTRLTAPFAGVVTSRSTQIGALVTAGSAASTPLFTISDVHRVRIFVRVPQSFSAQLSPGLHASLTLPEYPGRKFDAVTTRSAGAVDQQSGTVLIELQAANAERVLKPGAYAQVSLPISSTAGNFSLPASAMLFRDAGPAVAIVGPGNRATIRPVIVARDEGAKVQIASGLTGRERVIDSPPDALSDGDTVDVQPAGAEAASDAAR